jgi:hypothetical protein
MHHKGGAEQFAPNSAEPDALLGASIHSSWLVARPEPPFYLIVSEWRECRKSPWAAQIFVGKWANKAGN